MDLDAHVRYDPTDSSYLGDRYTYLATVIRTAH